tara:strand:+ start:115 stop:1017 length:903 start_codon:yes stop_codon:yes gene_type:complete
MSWLERFTRPKVRKIFRKPDIPEDLWEKCPKCGQMIFHRDLASNMNVCTQCGFHMQISPKRRFESLFDDSIYELLDLPKGVNDPLRFRDRKRYSERLREARNSDRSALDALEVAHGKMGDRATVIAAFDFSFLGGSMGVSVGNGFLSATKLAISKRAPLIVIPSSGGARMQEGALSLMQMARTTIAVDELKAADLPYIVVFTNPTTGGVTASFSMLGDIAIAEPGALIGFAGQRVIEETIRQKLPDDFQKSEYLLDHGMVDMVIPRKQLREELIKIISLLTDHGDLRNINESQTNRAGII